MFSLAVVRTRGMNTTARGAGLPLRGGGGQCLRPELLVSLLLRPSRVWPSGSGRVLGSGQVLSHTVARGVHGPDRDTGFAVTDTVAAVLRCACVEGDLKAPGVMPRSLGGAMLGPLAAALTGAWGLAFQGWNEGQAPCSVPLRGRGMAVAVGDMRVCLSVTPRLPTLACHPQSPSAWNTKGALPWEGPLACQTGGTMVQGPCRVILVGLCRGLSRTHGQCPTDRKPWQGADACVSSERIGGPPACLMPLTGSVGHSVAPALGMRQTHSQQSPKR